MAKLGRPGMSDEDRATLWRLWSQGSSFSEISEIGYPPGSVYTVVKQTGGYLPPERRGVTPLGVDRTRGDVPWARPG